MGLLIDSRICKAEKENLERSFDLREIETNLNSLGSDKALDPNGMSLNFIKFLWPHLKEKVLECFLAFADGGSLPNGLNSSFVTLLPKIKVPQKVQDFRPISLINSIAKLLTKVLKNRIEPLVDKLIDDHQFGFVKKSQAAESILLVNEVYHFLHSSNQE